MIIYNETFIIDDTIENEWLNWIKTIHIPAVLATGCFDDAPKILTVIDSPNEGITFCIQYSTDSIDRYSKFHYHHMQELHQKHNKQFEERFVLFNTLMETVE